MAERKLWQPIKNNALSHAHRVHCNDVHKKDLHWSVMSIGETKMCEIPKIIHYIWFGRGPKSELIQKCIHSWQLYMPEYKIIEWNEDNYILNFAYEKEAMEHKKYAFV